MVKPNNPYAHTVHATKDTAKTIGEHYGTRATDKRNVHAAGNRNVSPAARYSVAGNAYVPPTDAKPKKAKPKTDPTHAVGSETVTAEDLFEW